MDDRHVNTINLVGDLMLQTRLSKLRRDQDTELDAVLERVRDSDVAIANLEMPLSRRGSKNLKHSNLRSDPEVIEDVRSMGFSVVTLANNHLMDYGPSALLDTIDACDHAGIRHCGAGATLDGAMTPVWLDVGGRRVALMNVASTIPLGAEATETSPGIAPLRVNFGLEIDTNLVNEQPGTMPIVRTWTRDEDQQAVCDQVRQLSDEADVVIVAIHWGVPSYWLSPYQGRLAQYQQPLGHALIDAGVDVVFGHHSHSLNAIEVYRGRPIFYSVGNFVFERPRDFMEPESLITQINVGKRLGVRLVPIWIDERGLPRVVSQTEEQQVVGKLAELSGPFNTVFEPSHDFIEVILE